jgi:hypothetical protein
MSAPSFQEIQSAIDALPEQDFSRLVEWLRERDWQQWDAQLEADVAAGKLDFLKQEASEAKTNSTLKEL